MELSLEVGADEGGTHTDSWEAGMWLAGLGEQMPVERGPGEAAAGGGLESHWMELAPDPVRFRLVFPEIT